MKRSLLLILLLIFSISCGKKKDRGKTASEGHIKKNSAFFAEVGDVRPYRKSKYSSKLLTKCVYASKRENSCTLKDLPMIFQEKSSNVIETVLDRTMVSNKLFGENFEKALKKIQSKYLWDMFGAVNAVVISDKIAASFYSSESGTIYLAGKYLWTNSEDKAKAESAVDTRGDNVVSETKAAIMFEEISANLINGESIFRSSWRNARSIDDLVPALFRVLIHELSHANDHLPVSERSKLNLSQPVGMSIRTLWNDYLLISDNFEAKPQSKLVLEYADSYYGGDPLTEKMKTITAVEFAKEYDNDVAVDVYGHYSQYEDVAMLAESAIKLAEYKIENVQGIAEFPKADFVIPDDYEYPLAWGQKNRILKPSIKERAMYVLDAMFENFDQVAYEDSIKGFKLEEATPGDSWSDFAYPDEEDDED